MAKARCKPRKAHPKCRPPVTHRPVRRLRDDGRFVRDNGDPGLAFIGQNTDDVYSATIWAADCNCKVYLDCPVAKALAYAAEYYNSATVVRQPTSRVKRKAPRKR